MKAQRIPKEALHLLTEIDRFQALAPNVRELRLTPTQFDLLKTTGQGIIREDRIFLRGLTIQRLHA
jgi:hypothetical protein